MNMLRRVGAGLAFVLRGAVVSVIGNVGLAALALALALTLWLFVTDKENPTQAQTFNSSIPVELVNVPESLAVANVSDAGVRIRIEAPKNELDGLRSDDFSATVDLGGLAAGTQSVSIDVTPPNSRINVIEITPARVDVTIEPLQRKDVPVRVSTIGSPVTGFVVADGGERAQPETATVSGPESIVRLVDTVVAVVNLTGQRVDVVEDRVKLEPRDAVGGGITRVSVVPDTAEVTIDLDQREYSLQFDVKPFVTGQPASGYNLAGTLIDPRFVTVTGTLEALEAIDSLRGLTTEEISISDARDDVIRTVAITLPEGVAIEGSVQATVTIDIAPAGGVFSFRIVPQIGNAGDGLTVTPAGPITVTLAGEVPILDTITAESIVATVDAEGLGAGLFTLPVTVTPPPFTSIVSVEPAALGVAITLQ
jgi:YbbR domain-containing protein